MIEHAPGVAETTWTAWIGREPAREAAVRIDGQMLFVSAAALEQAEMLWRAREDRTNDGGGRRALARLIASTVASTQHERNDLGRVLDLWADRRGPIRLPAPPPPTTVQIAEHLSAVAPGTRGDEAERIRSTFFPDAPGLDAFLVDLLATLWRSGGGR